MRKLVQVRLLSRTPTIAQLAELGDAPPSSSGDESRAGSTPALGTKLHIFDVNCVSVAELVDALDLGSSDFGRAGSTPVTRTNFYARLAQWQSAGLWSRIPEFDPLT